jgi:hypothetical protein
MTVSSGALADEHASKVWFTYSGCVSPGAYTRSQYAFTGWQIRPEMQGAAGGVVSISVSPHSRHTVALSNH